jgi:peptide methionine sulfoxide reductase msrA/msrB
MAQEKEEKYNKLTPEEERVMLHKGTEMPYTGEYVANKAEGYYTCKRCDAVLYRSEDKFDSRCGWPSFDDEIPDAVKRVPDADGVRTEIVCANCGGHLGHVFLGEGFTDKNVRHCVNSISMNFIPAKQTGAAYFAGGCFWGMQHFLNREDGVLLTRVGYMGGEKKNPDYFQVCQKKTGHAETVEVIFDKDKTDFETLARLFFEIHDPTQLNRQGPDVGDQYRSAIFYQNDAQKDISEKLIGILKDKGYDVVTQLADATEFWVAEDRHQNYYESTGKQPYCHGYTERF